MRADSPISSRLVARTRLSLVLILFAALTVVGCAPKKQATQDKPAAFWPTYPDEPRVQFLMSYKTSADVEPPKSKLDELVLGKEIQQVMGLQKPYGVEMYDGKIYVCDLRTFAVTVLDLRKHRTLVIGKTGSDTLSRPTDIAISQDDGMKYVADMGKGMIYVFDKDEKLVGKIGHPDLQPVGVALYQDELFVCDFKGQRIDVFNRKTGELLRTFGQRGSGEGQFVTPLGIATDKDGYVYVTDVLNCRMQKFDRQGKLINAFGMVSASAGGMVRPKQIAVDNDGMIYVVDAAFQNVQIFDQIGRVYTFFGSPGTHPGSMYLPVGISVHEGDLDLFSSYIHPAFEAQRLILVTNQFGENKVSVYALGHLKPGKTVADIAASKDVVSLGMADPKKAQRLSQPTTSLAPDESSAPTTPAAQETPAMMPSQAPVIRKATQTPASSVDSGNQSNPAPTSAAGK